MATPQAQVEYIAPEFNNLLVEPVIPASGDPVSAIKSLNTNTVFAQVLVVGPTVTGNIKQQSFVYFPSEASTPFADARLGKTLLVVAENKVIATRKYQQAPAKPQAADQLRPRMAGQ